jgi:hypothetical protein
VAADPGTLLIIGAIVGSGGVSAMVTAWFKSRGEASRLALDTEKTRADITTERERLYSDRINRLEERIDMHHQECQELIDRALREEREHCDKQMGQLRKDLVDFLRNRRSLDEISEPEDILG